jgi:host factor-I protein
MAGTSVQDSFLTDCVSRGTPVTIHLLSGLQLHGIVKAFDPFTLLLEYEQRTNLVYKHAITTISPAIPWEMQ